MGWHAATIATSVQRAAGFIVATSQERAIKEGQGRHLARYPRLESGDDGAAGGHEVEVLSIEDSAREVLKRDPRVDLDLGEV